MRSAFTMGLMAAYAAAGGVQTAEEVIEIIDGVLVAVFEVEQVDNLDTCIKDFTPLATSMDTAVKDFGDASFHNIADGIYQLGQFISQVGILMEDCAAVGDEDVTKLTAMGEAFLHPKQLVIDAEHNVIMNGIQIAKDIKKAGNYMDQGEYEKAGEMYGTVGALILWGDMNYEAYSPFLA